MRKVGQLVLSRRGLGECLLAIREGFWTGRLLAARYRCSVRLCCVHRLCRYGEGQRAAKEQRIEVSSGGSQVAAEIFNK